MRFICVYAALIAHVSCVSITAFEFGNAACSTMPARVLVASFLRAAQYANMSYQAIHPSQNPQADILVQCIWVGAQHCVPACRCHQHEPRTDGGSTGPPRKPPRPPRATAELPADDSGAGDGKGGGWQGWRDRVDADPKFVFKVLTEQVSSNGRYMPTLKLQPAAVTAVVAGPWHTPCAEQQ